jgi:hypothetical protein
MQTKEYNQFQQGYVVADPQVWLEAYAIQTMSVYLSNVDWTHGNRLDKTLLMASPAGQSSRRATFKSAITISVSLL